MANPATEIGARQEVASYINYRMKLAGLMAEQLPDKAVVNLVFRASNGIPRLIGTLCSGANHTSGSKSA